VSFIIFSSESELLYREENFARGFPYRQTNKSKWSASLKNNLSEDHVFWTENLTCNVKVQYLRLSIGYIRLLLRPVRYEHVFPVFRVQFHGQKIFFYTRILGKSLRKFNSTAVITTTPTISALSDHTNLDILQRLLTESLYQQCTYFDLCILY
jgi:hypothetical protein